MTTRPVPLIDKPNAKPSALENLTERLNAEGIDPSARSKTQEDRIPAKFRGKSLEDVIDSYVNLEQRFGQLGNDHGTLRNRVDQMLELKRADDLRSGSAPEERAKVSVTPTEIIDNPSEVLSTVRDQTLQEADARMNARVSELEASLKAERFSVKHPDFAELNNTAEFINWVAASSSRAKLAEIARNTRDYDLADSLLTEFKAGLKSPGGAEQSRPSQSNNDRAREASFESSSASGTRSKSGERYRRSDLIELKVNNPKKYALLGDKITRAYLEGRVDD